MKTRITEMFGIDYPILGFTPSPEVAAAISRAGGLGVLGAVRYTHVEELEDALTYLDEATEGRPYGLDIVMPQKYVGDDVLDNLEGMIDERHKSFVAELLDRFGVPELPADAKQASAITAWMHSFARAQVDAALRHRIALLANALGPPPVDIIEEAHQHGMKVAALAGKAGVDILVAVGHEAGGHCGDVTTMVLVPEIVDAAQGLPVLAAGGIGTGRQIAASLALGADGVWLGSLWLTTSEYQLEPATANGHSVVKNKLLAASSSDTVRSKVISGKPARMLRTPWTEAWEAPGSPGTLPMPLQGILVADAEARIRAVQNEDLMGSPVGQIVGQMNAVEPVETVIRRLVAEYEEAADRLASLRRA
jgi:NAD(P)H-dependent flavin oxidoreductase YrpB (nitropropane dioxygenase family)